MTAGIAHEPGRRSSRRGATLLPFGVPQRVEQRPPSAELLSELTTLARTDGAHAGPWPHSSLYRFTRPTSPRWADIGHLGLAVIVAPASAQVRVDEHHFSGATAYTVVGDHRRFDCQIVRASPRQPTLCVVLGIDARLVQTMSTSIAEISGPAFDSRGDHVGCSASTMDDVLTRSVVRFLRTRSTACDRGILAPLALQEIVYHLLHRDQASRLMRFAAQRDVTNPVRGAVDHIRSHFAEPLTVDGLAARVCLSPSAFSRAFRETTGCSPYQYLKATRLEEARRLLTADRARGVKEVSREVGYASVSHFIKEFRVRFGATPGDYARAARLQVSDRRLRFRHALGTR